jgi:signal transduction histidine kinase
MMLFRNIPIRKKLMRIFFLTSGIVILLTCLTFFVYEFYAFRKSSVAGISTIGRIIATNSTAALAFDNKTDASEILAALKSEPHITVACLFDKNGNFFAGYTRSASGLNYPIRPETEMHRFIKGQLESFQPVIHDKRQLGTLFLRSDLADMYKRLRAYGLIVALVILVFFLLAYALSKVLQKSISKPILSLAQTTREISEQGDFSKRAEKFGEDEMGKLTDDFNQMLARIEHQSAELHEFNQTLEQKVEERTRELETVNHELESFSYSVSHDLRAPLRAIIGFTAMLEEDHAEKLDDDAKYITSVIKESTSKMGVLIDDLLSFSRLGRQSILKVNVDSNLLVRGVIQDIGPDEKQNEWLLHELPYVEGDINTLRQVWINLISNAVKYSRNNERPRIEIGSFTGDGQIVFFIKDNGVGFDQQYAGKLFKVFQRLHGEDEFEGTGVGLAIVEKIVFKHGGRIWAESQINKGATFFFSLPHIIQTLKPTA